MFNKPTRRKKLYAVIVDGEFVGVFPTKKMSKELSYSGNKEVIELFWNGGFFGKDLDTSYASVAFNYEDRVFDF